MPRRSRRRVPKATRPDEYRLLLEHAPSDLYRDLFVVMRWSGLRVAEAVGLCWENVDLARLQMTVTGKGDVERSIDILPEAETMLRRRTSARAAYLSEISRDKAGHNFVFPKPDGQPLTTRAVQRILQRIREKLGLPAERLTPHKLRHAYATDLVNRGVPIHVVSAQLGHASVATTTVYLWAQPGQARRYFEE